MLGTSFEVQGLNPLTFCFIWDNTSCRLLTGSWFKTEPKSNSKCDIYIEWFIPINLQKLFHKSLFLFLPFGTINNVNFPTYCVKQYDTSALIASFTAHAIQSMPSGKAPGFPDLLWSSTKSSHPSWRQTFCWMFPFLLHLNLENCINHLTTGLLSLIIVPAFNETRLFCLY